MLAEFTGYRDKPLAIKLATWQRITHRLIGTCQGVCSDLPIALGEVRRFNIDARLRKPE
ncbi:hypothetical protein AWB74_07638 [Caballeronia arvi]|uniref:Uncharacterized protein n=1 Tax=Caballeronia arvi TaxID=1777135 RepID=A0A158L0V5_9BURK|nr:hypothetical protein AWB74_07638 [Caballeronia arvi]